MKRWSVCVELVGVLCLGPLSAWAAGHNQFRQVGVARIDITPDYPVRLAGYAARTNASEGVAQQLWAKALAIGSDKEQPAILITVDNCGVPGNVRDEVVRQLERKGHIAPGRVAVCSTHTHSAPWLEGYLPNLSGGPIPADHQTRREQYTRELTGALVTVALKALEDRQPARLGLGKGEAGFAANRRTKGGPADHDVPVLFVTDPAGKLRVILASYACHCTTLTGEFNQICGDWAGYAQEDLERQHPEVIAMISLGCAGDINPDPRPGFELARQHGQEIAAAVERILTASGLTQSRLAAEPTPLPAPAPLAHVDGSLVCRTRQLELPLETLPTRAEWKARAGHANPYISNQARMNLARLERGEKLPTKVPYLVQTWAFGDDLAMVFLPGEVVVDYSLRLKREFDARRLWVNAYANDVPCYIPSERILNEGGYEGTTAMVYYDEPARFASGVEELIVSTVHKLLPRKFNQAR